VAKATDGSKSCAEWDRRWRGRVSDGIYKAIEGAMPPMKGMFAMFVHTPPARLFSLLVIYSDTDAGFVHLQSEITGHCCPYI
jgi:hypothetical protein